MRAWLGTSLLRGDRRPACAAPCRTLIGESLSMEAT
jgi:hypothetical protein